jgi:hypothetical protein
LLRDAASTASHFAVQIFLLHADFPTNEDKSTCALASSFESEMKRAMRVPILLVCAVLFVKLADATPLADADREALLDNLEQLRETANATVDARYRLALVAYRSAMASDDAAIELYLKCVEKVDFEDQQKKPADFREWKNKEADKLSDPGLRLALRHQLRWLVLTLQAASGKIDRQKLAGDAQDVVGAIFREPEKLRAQEGILSQAVTASVFAKAYNINSVKVDKWALSPTQLDQIYDEILLPPYRNPGHLDTLRATWIKRIQQEGAKYEFWSEPAKGGRNEDKKGTRRVGMAADMQPPAYEKFLAETQPQLQWDMEIDLFRNGDESAAAVRMFAHLEKSLAHPSVRQWGEQFEELLKAKPAPTALKAAEPAETKP